MDKQNSSLLTVSKAIKEHSVKSRTGIGFALIASAITLAGCASKEIAPENAQQESSNTQTVQQSAQAVETSTAPVEPTPAQSPQKSETENVASSTTSQEEADSTPQSSASSTSPAKAAENTKPVKKASAQLQVQVKSTTEQASAQAQTTPPAASTTEVQTTAAPEAVAQPAPSTKSVNKQLLSNLPMTEGPWTLAPNPLASDKRPYLKSLTLNMGGSEYSSQVWITVEDQYLIVNSTSDIDTRGAGSAGVQINGNSLIPFTRYTGTTAAIDQNLLGQLDDGGKLTIKLGFFPERNSTPDIQTSEASIDGLKKLIPAYRSIVN